MKVDDKKLNGRKLVSASNMRRSVESSNTNSGAGTSIDSPFASAARDGDASGSSGHGMVKPKPLRLDVGCHSPIGEEEEYLGRKESKLTPFGSLRGFGGTGNQYHTPLVRCLL